MTTLQEILRAAQQLPSKERATLIATLWDDVIPNDWIPPDQQWIDEANRRFEAYETGQMRGSPWEDVRQRARRKSGLDG